MLDLLHRIGLMPHGALDMETQLFHLLVRVVRTIPDLDAATLAPGYLPHVHRKLHGTRVDHGDSGTAAPTSTAALGKSRKLHKRQPGCGQPSEHPPRPPRRRRSGPQAMAERTAAGTAPGLDALTRGFPDGGFSALEFGHTLRRFDDMSRVHDSHGACPVIACVGFFLPPGPAPRGAILRLVVRGVRARMGRSRLGGACRSADGPRSAGAWSGRWAAEDSSGIAGGRAPISVKLCVRQAANDVGIEQRRPKWDEHG